MKHLLILFVTTSVIFSSCRTFTCYQVVQTAPSEGNNVSNALTFSNQDVDLVFDFWGEGGLGGFSILNKSSRNLTINLDTTFLIVNGKLNVFFDNATFEMSKSNTSSSTGLAAITDRVKPNPIGTSKLTSAARGMVAAAATASASSGVAVTTSEKARVVIPPSCSAYLYEAQVSDKSFKACDLQRNPYRKVPEGRTLSKEFDEENSPITISFVVNFTIGQQSHQLHFPFYAKTVTNHKQMDLLKIVREDECGKPLFESYKEFKDPNVASFYNRYVIR